MQTLTRETVAVSSLKPAPWNPRKIDANAMAGLEASIEKFGLVQEIVVNRRSMQVVGGHQRLKVLKRKKVKDAAVVFVDLDEPDEKALNVALNSPHISGEFIDDLQAILEGIQLADESLFEGLLLDKLLGEGAPTFEPEDLESLKRLDEKKMIVCPNCQHEFSPS